MRFVSQIRYISQLAVANIIAWLVVDRLPDDFSLEQWIGIYGAVVLVVLFAIVGDDDKQR